MEVAKQSADAAHRGADAAQQSADVAKESMQRTLRAYVVVLSATPNDLEYFGVPQRSHISIIKTGQTPATHLEYHADLKLLSEPPTAAKIPITSPHFVTQDILAPRSPDPRVFMAMTGLTEEESFEISRGRGRILYLFGLIRYSELFADERRTTYFCFGLEEVYNRQRLHSALGSSGMDCLAVVNLSGGYGDYRVRSEEPFAIEVN